jgi:hypothetical protein
VDPFAAGHLGELTRIVSFDLVDAAINSAGAAQKRIRRLPTRVVVYVLLAGVLFADVGYRQVLARLVRGAGLNLKVPGSSALFQACRRIGSHRWPSCSTWSVGRRPVPRGGGHHQRTDRGDQRTTRTPPRLRPRVQEPDQLHRPVAPGDRRVQTPTTPSIVKSPLTPRHVNKFSSPSVQKHPLHTAWIRRR